jgi:hypothetical protein
VHNYRGSIRAAHLSPISDLWGRRQSERDGEGVEIFNLLALMDLEIIIKKIRRATVPRFREEGTQVVQVVSRNDIKEKKLLCEILRVTDVRWTFEFL